MATASSVVQDPCETDQLTEAQNSPRANMETKTFGNKLYSVLFWFWALAFWIAMFIGALHGLVMKGPVELYKNRQQWEQEGNLLWWHWCILALIIVFFAFCEGYRGFQCAWSPMVVKRSYHFSAVSSPIYNYTTVIFLDRLIDFLLAPLLAAGHICGTRRRLILSWGLTIFVVALIVLVSYMPEDLPWKSFIDIGVVIGLGWGLVFILVWWIKIGILKKWPDWVPNEYPTSFVVKLPENILTRVSEKSTSNGKVDNSLNEVVTVPYIDQKVTKEEQQNNTKC